MSKILINIPNSKFRYAGTIPEEVVSEITQKYNFQLVAPGQRLKRKYSYSMAHKKANWKKYSKKVEPKKSSSEVHNRNSLRSNAKRFLITKLDRINQKFHTNISSIDIYNTVYKDKGTSGRSAISKVLPKISKGLHLDLNDRSQKKLLEKITNFFLNYDARKRVFKWSEEKMFRKSFGRI